MSPYEIRLSYAGLPHSSPIRFRDLGPAVTMWGTLIAVVFEAESFDFYYDRNKVFEFVEAGGRNLDTPILLASVTISPRGLQLFRRVAFCGVEAVSKKGCKENTEKTWIK